MPINRTDEKEKVEQVYEKFSRLEHVVKLFLVESDLNYHYLFFEKMDMSLATYIEKEKDSPLEHTRKRSIQLQIIRYIKVIFLFMFFYSLSL